MKKCVAYIRVSTEKQVEEGYGLDSQQRDIMQYAGNNNLLISEWYIDAGISGMDMIKRVNLQRLISDLTDIDCVIVYKLDRLSRDTVDALYMIEKIFKPKNVEVISVHDFASYETPQEKFQTHIMAAVAEYDRNTMLLRMRGGMLERVKNGYWYGGGNLPYCYSYDREKGILIPIEDRAIQARAALELYIQGDSEESIAKKLNYKAEGTVKSILTSKVNVGMILYKGNVYQGLHEPIFDKDRFELGLQKRKERSQKRTYQSNTATYELSSLCYCGECGCAMRYQKWNDGKTAIYCYSRNKSMSYLPNWNPDCKSKIVFAPEIEKAVEEEIGKMALNFDKEYKADETNLIEVYESKMVKLKDKIKRLYELYADGNDTVVEIIKEKENEINELKSKIADEEEKKANRKKPEEIISDIKKVADILPYADNKIKNKFLKSIIQKIIICNNKIEIQLKNY